MSVVRSVRGSRGLENGKRQDSRCTAKVVPRFNVTLASRCNLSVLSRVPLVRVQTRSMNGRAEAYPC